IWEFAGEEVAGSLRKDARRLASELVAGKGWVNELRALISAAEIRAVVQRARRLADVGRYPEPTSRWVYPWPMVYTIRVSGRPVPVRADGPPATAASGPAGP